MLYFDFVVCYLIGSVSHRTFKESATYGYSSRPASHRPNKVKPVIKPPRHLDNRRHPNFRDRKLAS